MNGGYIFGVNQIRMMYPNKHIATKLLLPIFQSFTRHNGFAVLAMDKTIVTVCLKKDDVLMRYKF
jgi:hypothetical protein